MTYNITTIEDGNADGLYAYCHWRKTKQRITLTLSRATIQYHVGVAI